MNMISSAIYFFFHIGANTNNGYNFASFDVTSLFPNMLLNRTVNIALDRVYDKNLVNTNSCKRTLKDLIKGTCGKTVFAKEEIVSLE